MAVKLEKVSLTVTDALRDDIYKDIASLLSEIILGFGSAVLNKQRKLKPVHP